MSVRHRPCEELVSATSLAILSLVFTTNAPSAESSSDLVALTANTFEFDPAGSVPDQDQATTAGAAAEVQLATPSQTAPADVSDGDRYAPFGTTGTWRLNLIAGVPTNFKNATTPQFSVGASYFIAPYLSLDPQATVLYADQEGQNAFAAGFSLLFRWHFIHCETWTVYFEGGAGMIFSTEDIPEGASHLNFTPQICIGGTIDLGNDVRLMAAAGWYHISNANSAVDNDGRDQLMLYAGLSFPF